jgi:peptidoglycan hydrolase-like protein with peptidoglycan-binding domain
VLRARPRTIGIFYVVLLLAVSLAPAGLARAASLGSRTLRPGTQGGDVKTLQTQLTEAGFKTVADGRFGPGTTRSVRSFERRFGLKVNGVVNRGVVRTLREVLFGDAGSPPLGARTLRQGVSGEDVRTLQRDLTTTGYPTSVDGRYGSATKARVLDFERDNGLAATGVVTYQQTQILRQLVAIVALGGQDSGLGGGTATPAPPPSTKATGRTTINPDGTATAPPGAPRQVQQVVAAANQIIDTPYVWGGGHGSWNSRGYDCSGSVSYALHGGGLLSSPEVSGALETYGAPGPGKWITIYANASHVFMVVAGRAFDTANFGGPNIPGGSGPRWRSNPTGNLSDGAHYWVVHPPGL